MADPTPRPDPLAVRCRACLAAPGDPCIGTTSDLPRERVHRLRPLAASPRLVHCPDCEGSGWRDAGHLVLDETECPVCGAAPHKRCTEGGRVRDTAHEVRRRAAQAGVESCPSCDAVGWVPDEPVTTPRPDDVPTRGVHVIPGQIPEGHVPPSASMAAPGPRKWCAASARTFGRAMPHIGPCVLRAGHDGPVHQDENGAQWTEPTPRPDVPDELVSLAQRTINSQQWEDEPTPLGEHDKHGFYAFCAVCQADMARVLPVALAAVLPEIERRVREQTLREAADLLDSKPLHCEKHLSVRCTKCPVGSDHLRVWVDRIARGEAR